MRDIELKSRLEKEYNIFIDKEVILKDNIFSYVSEIITNSGDKFVLRKWKDKTKNEQIEKIYYVHNLLDNIYIPKILISKSGRYLVEYKERRYSIYGFIEHDFEMNVTNEYMRQLGNVIRKLHEDLKHVNKDDNFRKISKERELESIYKIAENTECINKFEYDYLSRCIKMSEFMWVYSKENLQYIHGDLNNGNILLKNGKIVGIIDFDHLQFNSIYLDIATIILETSVKSGKINWDFVRSFFEGYGLNGNYEKNQVLTLVIVKILNEISYFDENINLYLKRKNIKKYLSELIILMYKLYICNSNIETSSL